MNTAKIGVKALLMLLTAAALAVGIWFYVVYAKKDGSMSDGTFVYNGKSMEICMDSQEYETEEPARDTWRPLNRNRGYFV